MRRERASNEPRGLCCAPLNDQRSRLCGIRFYEDYCKSAERVRALDRWSAVKGSGAIALSMPLFITMMGFM